ncbi:hypothetical protein KAM622c_27760 [Klebsiella quasipneumoniae subsp. quasipneumoniae]|nr:hypothetical protein KAM622c_27760 [Klebsiella quasipneumoniae subsp. quasipneumoniae]
MIYSDKTEILILLLIVKAGQLPGAAFYRDAKAEFEQLLNGLRRGGGPGLLG